MTHPEGRFWRAKAVDDYVELLHGNIGEPGVVDVVMTYEEFNTPPEYSLDQLADGLFEQGYRFAPIPDVHVEIEAAHSVTLPARIREFYAANEYLEYQDYFCEGLNCHVNFVSDAVLGNYMQEHYDSERGEHREFVPISARVYDGYEDEQQWIGIDPEEPDGPIYALYTSGEFDVAYPNFAEFLADLAAPAEV